MVKTGQFLYRTLSAKGELKLDDVRLKRAVQGADVFLDTAIRFQPGDENSATDQRKFADMLFALQGDGARTITGAHHAPKNFENRESMTLENTLRGSGDIGAMLATCWAVKQQDRLTNRLLLQNVKSRDFEACASFEVTGRPHIDRHGQFKMTAVPGMADHSPTQTKMQAALEEAKVMRLGGSKLEEIAQHLPVSLRTVKKWSSDGRLRAELEELKGRSPSKPILSGRFG